MAQTKVIQRRIRSVKNAKQITKALEVVAASRMRRVVEAVERSRTYGNLAAEIMSRIAPSPEAKAHPFFAAAADNKPTLYIAITSDRGQAGAFNSNVFNLTLASIKVEKIRPQVVVFGRKGARHFARGTNIELLGDYEGVADDPDVNVFAPVLETIADGIAAGRFGSVVLIYTEPISTMTQHVRTLQLIPIAPPRPSNEPENQPDKVVFEFEPDSETVLESALRLYFESSLRRARIDAAAAEHAMRMISMNNANRNAAELIDILTLELNATRQAAITQEMAEIIGGANAIA